MPSHRLLIVEDDRVSSTMLTRTLSRRGYEVRAVESVAEARKEMATRLPDVLLLDIFMPQVSGFDFLDELRKNAATATLPVILISGLSDPKHIVEGLQRGANDYVTKPFILPILTARVEALLRSSALVRSLEVQTELLSRLAAFDELTGTYNRRSMFHALETELGRCRRYGRSVSVLMMDLDYFKRVNDEHGHAAGDTVLRDVAQTTQNALRAMDVVCRYGGEEFCIILPETVLSGGARAAERVRSAVEQHPVTAHGHPVAVTVSLGVSAWTPTDEAELPDLLAEADGALMDAKREGRNRVRIFDRIKGLSHPPEDLERTP